MLLFLGASPAGAEQFVVLAAGAAQCAHLGARAA